MLDISEIGSIPLMQDAIAIFGRVKLHTGQIHDIFDEEFFMQGLHRFYSHWEDGIKPSSLWQCKFYIILAFGIALSNNSKAGTRSLSRSCYFRRALSLLSGVQTSCEDPVTAIQVWYSVALYYKCLKEWKLSFNGVGQSPGL